MTFSYEDVSDTVLYDIFYEAGTRLKSCYIDQVRKARKNNDKKAEQYWRNKITELNMTRNRVESNDRNTQIKYIKEWNANE